MTNNPFETTEPLKLLAIVLERFVPDYHNLNDTDSQIKMLFARDVAKLTGISRRLNISGEALNNVVSAQEFLFRVGSMEDYKNAPIQYGDRVVVIGCGDLMLDAAISARKLGGHVTVFYRYRREDLPAGRASICCAEEEEIKFKFLTTPVEFAGNDAGKITTLFCQAVMAEKSQTANQSRPPYLDDTIFQIEADVIIVDVGTSADDYTVCGVTTDYLSKETVPGCFFSDGTEMAGESVRTPTILPKT